MLIVRDSQVKKLFYKGQEIDKILDWKGNVVFVKESAPVMTNTIKFHTTSAVTSGKRFTVTYTDSTSDEMHYSEPNKFYTVPIPTDKIVKGIDSSSSYIDEIIFSCKVSLSAYLISGMPNIIKFISCDATSNTSLSNAFINVANKSVEVRNLDARNATNLDSLCYNAKGLESIILRDLNVSNATSMQYMFRYCSGATTIDVTNWDTSSATNLKYAFADCNNLKSIDLSSWNVSNVTNMEFMFYNCSSFTSLDLSRFDVSLVTSMSGIFEGCSSLTSLDLSSWKVGINLRNLDYAFRYCSSLTYLDISGWDLSISNISKMYAMFVDCKALKTIYMRGCNQKTIDKIKKQLSFAKLNNVTIVTE